MAHFFPYKVFTFEKFNYEIEDGKTSVCLMIIIHNSAEASWNIIALGCIFGRCCLENVFWHQLPSRNSEASECMRDFIEELKQENEIWGL